MITAMKFYDFVLDLEVEPENNLIKGISVLFISVTRCTNRQGILQWAVLPAVTDCSTADLEELTERTNNAGCSERNPCGTARVTSS